MSSSSLTMFLGCGQRWYYRYVLKLPSPPNVRTVIGNATHAAVEHNLGQKIVSKEDLPVQDVLDAYSTRFDAEVPDIEKQEEPIGKGKDSGAGLVRLHHAKVAPTITPLAVEQPTQFNIGGKPYSTTLDLLDQTPRGVRVRELKTTARAPDPKAHLFQIVGGALSYRQHAGKKEADNQLDFLVRNKVPVYDRVTWGGPIEDSAIRVFGQQIENANKMIDAGLYVANGVQNHVCGYCSYQMICPAYRAVYGKQVIRS